MQLTNDLLNAVIALPDSEVLLSIDDIPNQELDITIYPNPVVDDVLQINNTQYNNFNLSLYNMEGKLVFKDIIVNGNNTFNISHLASGIYIARMQNNEIVVNKKVLIK